MIDRRCIWAMILVGWASVSGTAMAGERPPFGDFIGQLRAVCDRPPASSCADRVFAFFDTNGDGGVSRREFEAVRLMARAAMRQPPADISQSEHGMIAIALFVLESVGSGAVFAGFDGDSDGRIARTEMFADFHLDKRSFNDVVADPATVDWQAFAKRFGKSGDLFLPLLTTAGNGQAASGGSPAKVSR